MITRSFSGPRRGISLIEVLSALAIFLFSLIAIGHLISQSVNRADEIQMESQAARLCESKLAEVVAGIQPMSSSEGSFDEDPDWNWSIEADQGTVAGLWNVTVTVHKALSDGSRVEFALNQAVLDPAVRGSSFDPPAASTSADTSASSGSTTPASGGTTQPAPAGSGAGVGGMTKPGGTTTPGAGGTGKTPGATSTTPTSPTTPTTPKKGP
jgi:type II secretion system protein I